MEDGGWSRTKNGWRLVQDHLMSRTSVKLFTQLPPFNYWLVTGDWWLTPTLATFIRLLARGRQFCRIKLILILLPSTQTEILPPSLLATGNSWAFSIFTCMAQSSSFHFLCVFSLSPSHLLHPQYAREYKVSHRTQALPQLQMSRSSVYCWLLLNFLLVS